MPSYLPSTLEHLLEDSAYRAGLPLCCHRGSCLVTVLLQYREYHTPLPLPGLHRCVAEQLL